MSIAEEYAARCAAAKKEPKKFVWETGGVERGNAYVTPNGDFVYRGQALDPAGALALARWIVVTFGPGGATGGDE